jgi:hypothetical protein
MEPARALGTSRVVPRWIGQDYHSPVLYGIHNAGGNMRFRQLPLCCCECGGHVPARIRQVGLTPQHQLVIHWWCLGCKRNIYTVKELYECWRECPTDADDLKVAETSELLMREPDAKFLRSLGIALPDDEPALRPDAKPKS